MANVTDPLAHSVHGTNPQNLVEYITRQKIYDSLYWKEECFGLSASDVATKATDLKALGGSYGGNNKPTRFLCLALKLLQIQPEEGIVEEFLENEEFKYVRALGAFYLRLTGRPAEIYELIEPLFNDFRKLRFRESTGWKVTYMDELADELLTSDRYCGIALPHLPKRDVLVSAGYLDGPRRSAMMPLIEEQAGGDAEMLLQRMAENGNEAAKAAMDERRKRKREAEEKELQMLEQRKETTRDRQRYDDERGRGDYNGRNCRVGGDYYGRDMDRRDNGRYDDRERDYHRRYRDDRHDDKNRGHSDGRGHRNNQHEERGSGHSNERKSKGDKKYGSLFKKNSQGEGRNESQSRSDKKSKSRDGTGDAAGVIEESDEYWNEQRAKLGLKPLK
jgi:pre-mRNA-splicing factor 38A